MNFSIVEVFPSIQGEGLDVGVGCVFIRFSGCNRTCVWCDTDWSKGEVWEIDELVKEVCKHKEKYVVLTGGEPLCQKNAELVELTRLLVLAGKEVAVETNGTIYTPGLHLVRMAISPKLSSSGRAFTEIAEVYALLSEYNAFLKFVISDITDAEEARDIIEKLSDIGGLTVVFQPEFNSMRYVDLPDLMYVVLEDLLKLKTDLDIRFIPQVHKLVGVK